MVVTIYSIAIAGIQVIGVLCFIILGIAALTDADSPIVVGIATTCIALWIICAGTAAFRSFEFRGDLPCFVPTG